MYSSQLSAWRRQRDEIAKAGLALAPVAWFVMLALPERRSYGHRRRQIPPRPVPKLGLFEIDHKSAATRFDIRSQLGGHLHGDDPPKG